VLASLHILAALKHGLFDRDGVLGRMSSWASIGLFVIAFIVGVSLLSVPAPSENEAASASTAAPRVATPISPSPPLMIDTTLPLWNVDQRQSYLRFTADQAGAPFTGSWQRWSADIRFDPSNLSASSAHVRVDVTSPATGDNERDATLLKPEWFDSSVHPEVVFRSIGIFAAQNGGYTATGTLRIRNSEHPVRLNFSHQRVNDQDTITGSVDLDRIELGIGTGEWTDTSWVGQHVKVEFQVTGA
jgi:polyisoprenoid-binding protein YceI